MFPGEILYVAVCARPQVCADWRSSSHYFTVVHALPPLASQDSEEESVTAGSGRLRAMWRAEDKTPATATS